MSKPRKGSTEKGRSMDPTELQEEPAAPANEKPRSAPAPGVPVSRKEYERMKENAEKANPPDVANAQEDCSTDQR